jgi:hypothetical protein
MNEKSRIIQYGVGQMGINMVKLLQSKPGVRVVGAIDCDEAKIGRDLGEVAGIGRKLGVTVQFPPEKVLANIEADVALHATTAFMDDAFSQLMTVLDSKINVITIAQELVFPIGKNVEKAKELDAKAKEMGVSMTAVGLNPGFIMDIVPIVCSLPCWEIKRVFCRRIVDFSPFGPDEMRHIGAGLSSQEFVQGVKDGTIGHIGLLETAAMVAHCLGLHVDELRQKKEPVITRKERKTNFVTIKPGRVCGFKQDVTGLRGEEEVLGFKMVGLVLPDKVEDGVELGDYTRISGTPSVDITIKEEIAQRAGLGAPGVAVNMIPKILEAPPGFHTMNNLTLPHFWAGGIQPKPIENTVRF